MRIFLLVAKLLALKRCLFYNINFQLNEYSKQLKVTVVEGHYPEICTSELMPSLWRLFNTLIPCLALLFLKF